MNSLILSSPSLALEKQQTAPLKTNIQLCPSSRMVVAVDVVLIADGARIEIGYPKGHLPLLIYCRLNGPKAVELPLPFLKNWVKIRPQYVRRA